MYSLDLNLLSARNQHFISERASEQEVLIPSEQFYSEIPFYLEKWRSIAIQTGPIDRKQAKEAVKAAYAVLGKQEPEILFFDSPYAALSDNLSLFGDDSWSQLENLLDRQVWHLVVSLLESKLEKPLERKLEKLLGRLLGESELDECIHTEFWICYASVYDFCICVLNCNLNPKLWEAFQGLLKYCGLILFNNNTCIICDRPTKLSFDSENRFHAEGEPCLEYADGFARMYAYHGVRLPEKYGKLHPNQWQAQWLLYEDNAELRRVLIQGIGYSKICQELQVIELDSWQEYTLLKIDNDVDVESIYLLKMTCPSTGFIHSLRVPPNVLSAKEAIAWVNWGIPPEEFSVQT